MSLNPVHGEVFLIQHSVINFVSDLRQVTGFLQVLQISSTNKTDCHNITKILLKKKTHSNWMKDKKLKIPPFMLTIVAQIVNNALCSFLNEIVLVQLKKHHQKQKPIKLLIPTIMYINGNTLFGSFFFFFAFCRNKPFL